MQKRGQVAAFIVIGLVVLILVLGIVAVKKDILTNLFKKITTERRALPQQVKPLQEFLDGCLMQVTTEGVNLLAQQGGYIEIPSDQTPTTPFSPLGPSLELISNSDFRTAVWYREKGNGIPELNMPIREDMEKSLSGYITTNFVECLSNLTSFSDQDYSIHIEAVPETTVRITEQLVSATVELPIKIHILDTEFTLSKHNAEINSNLGKLHKMSVEIMEKENKESFLEEKTIDMLVAYNEEVPFTGTDLSCTEKTWVKSDIEIKLKNILFENIAAMRIKGTNYELNDESLKYLEFDPLSTKDNKVTANLMYLPDWPTLIEINPSEGNILRSDSVSKRAGSLASIVSTFFCLNTYRFVYDIKYPVLITLTDENGLSFQFAMQVIIDNNQPKQNKLELLDVPSVDSPICQFPQRDVTIVTATLDNNDELVPLEDVSLSFKCFPASCPLGESELNAEGEPELKIKVPLCFNGVIEGTKEGYKQVQKTFFSSNDPEAPDFALVILEPRLKKQVKVLVIDKETGEPRDPYSTEQISFQFANVQTSYQTSYIYPNEEENIIELIPGEYVIDSYIMRESSTYKITFPKQTIEKCIDTRDFGLFGFFNTKQVCNSIETESVEFESVLTGGATGVVHEFTREELSSDDPLTLYILASPIPGSLEELQKTQIEIETNKDHPLFKYPEIE